LCSRSKWSSFVRHVFLVLSRSRSFFLLSKLAGDQLPFEWAAMPRLEVGSDNCVYLVVWVNEYWWAGDGALAWNGRFPRLTLSRVCVQSSEQEIRILDRLNTVLLWIIENLRSTLYVDLWLNVTTDPHDTQAEMKFRHFQRSKIVVRKLDHSSHPIYQLGLQLPWILAFHRISCCTSANPFEYELMFRIW
jgi:hypothetical protein